jgi:ATP-dependent Lon protease
VLIPEENVRDLAEIPDNIKNKLEIIPVRWIDQVLEHALERKPEPVPVVDGADVPPTVVAGTPDPAAAVTAGLTH